MIKSVFIVAIGSVWLLLATFGLHEIGWTKWTTPDAARFPDTFFCERTYYPTFGGACQVPSDVAYGLMLTSAVLLVATILGTVERIQRFKDRTAHNTGTDQDK